MLPAFGAFGSICRLLFGASLRSDESQLSLGCSPLSLEVKTGQRNGSLAEEVVFCLLATGSSSQHSWPSFGRA